MNYLYAAYIITWVVLIAYIAILGREFKRLAEDARDLER